MRAWNFGMQRDVIDRGCALCCDASDSEGDVAVVDAYTFEMIKCLGSLFKIYES